MLEILCTTLLGQEKISLPALESKPDFQPANFFCVLLMGSLEFVESDHQILFWIPKYYLLYTYMDSSKEDNISL